jgi:catechol 2,3-dioxygenase-like lactoylglutathione lyase family enzyme
MLLLLLTCARPGFALDARAPALDRVRLGVRDLPAALSWLDKVLGWKPAYRDDRRALVASGGVKLELEAAGADSAAALALSSDDADADYRRMLERGAVSIEAPSDRPSGFREAVVRGPGGLTLEIDGPLSQSPEFVYTEIAAGSGETPKASDTVRVRYVGTLKDGTVFDGGHRKGRPALVPLGSAVRCWSQGLTRMKVGGRATFVCPPGLAYGKEGRPPRIPPNATLVFDVELVGILR